LLFLGLGVGQKQQKNIFPLNFIATRCKMKKLYVLTILVVLFGLALTSLQVSASAGSDQGGQQKTPGAKATEKFSERATERATEGPGKPTDKPAGKPEDKEDKQDKQDKGEKPEKPEKPGKNQNFKGTLTTISATRLTLKTDGGDEVSVTIAASTKIGIPSMGKSARITDIQVGANVMVQAGQEKDGGWVARHVLVIPGKPVTTHHVGTVTKYIPASSITIVDQGGASFSFALTPQTKIQPEDRASLLAVGSRVTLIFGRNVTGAAPEVRGIVVHPEDDAPKP
jgi:hypothetical protein